MPGYLQDLRVMLERMNYSLTYNPEFIAQGTIIKDMQNPPMRLIEGVPVIDQESFWSRYLVPLFIRDLSSAVAEELTPITALDASSRGS